MKSCTIIISHYESLPFLRACIRQLKKYENHTIEQKIIIADQSTILTHLELISEFKGIEGISIEYMQPLYSGYGIDHLMRYGNVETDYVCQLHCDAFPIHKDWLKIPITLMEENDFKFTGVLQFICDKPEKIYPFKNPFFALAQCFNIGKTEVYKEMALQGGFTRFHNRKDAAMTWLNEDWAEWAKEDYNARGSDDDVPAFYWEDTYREHDKMSFGYTGIMGKGDEPNYGTIIEDLVFHFGYHREGIGVMPQMGDNYKNWTNRINQGYTDELIEEMISIAKANKIDPSQRRIMWDGKLKKATLTPHSINQRINELKNGLD